MRFGLLPVSTNRTAHIVHIAKNDAHEPRRIVTAGHPGIEGSSAIAPLLDTTQNAFIVHLQFDVTKKSEWLQKRDPPVYLSIAERLEAFARSRMRGNDHPHIETNRQTLQPIGRSEDVSYGNCDDRRVTRSVAHFGLWRVELSVRLDSPLRALRENDTALNRHVFEHFGRECFVVVAVKNVPDPGWK